MDSFFGGKKGMLRTWIRFGTETAWLLGEAMPQRTEAKSEGVPVNRLTLNRKRNTLSSEHGGNEERIDSKVDRVWWGRGREPGSCRGPPRVWPHGQPGSQARHSQFLGTDWFWAGMGMAPETAQLEPTELRVREQSILIRDQRRNPRGFCSMLVSGFRKMQPDVKMCSRELLGSLKLETGFLGF